MTSKVTAAHEAGKISQLESSIYCLEIHYTCNLYFSDRLRSVTTVMTNMAVSGFVDFDHKKRKHSIDKNDSDENFELSAATGNSVV